MAVDIINVAPIPNPASRYQLPEAAATSMPVAVQSFFSALCVPLSSPRDRKGTCNAAIFCRAAVTSALARIPAGSNLGPIMTKSLYITSKRLSPQPALTKSSSSSLECTKSTSPSPFLAFLMACPVPTATTRTVMPVSCVKTGKSASNNPEFCVDVVD